MNLGTLANWAQIFQSLPILVAAGGLYVHHRCHDCWRVSRHAYPDGRKACRRHRRLA